MDTLSFQIIDIISDDITIDEKKQFIISIYGIDNNNNKLICHVKKIYPYFFVKKGDKCRLLTFT